MLPTSYSINQPLFFFLYIQRHPDGVAQINMSDPEEADIVVQMMQGRYFGQRQLTAELWDGKTKFKYAFISILLIPL